MVLAISLLAVAIVFVTLINLIFFVCGYTVDPEAFIITYYSDGSVADVASIQKFYYALGGFTVTVTLVSVALGIALKTIKDKWGTVGGKENGC